MGAYSGAKARNNVDTTTQTSCICSDLQGVLCGYCRAQRLDLWYTAQSGNARIRCYSDPARKGYSVYALDGHELLPRTKSFTDEQAARDYANTLWATL